MLGKCEFLCKYVKYFSEIEISVFRNKTFSAQPKLVNPKQFLENRVCMIGTGIQHVVVLTTASKESSSRAPVLDKSALNERFELPKEEIKANGNVKPDQDERKQPEEPAKTEPVVEEAAEKQASAVEKVLSQKSEPKEVS